MFGRLVVGNGNEMNISDAEFVPNLHTVECCLRTKRVPDYREIRLWIFLEVSQCKESVRVIPPSIIPPTPFPHTQ
jgi:hypothetical protein